MDHLEALHAVEFKIHRGWIGMEGFEGAGQGKNSSHQNCQVLQKKFVYYQVAVVMVERTVRL